jgi:hypothetical protein
VATAAEYKTLHRILVYRLQLEYIAEYKTLHWIFWLFLVTAAEYIQNFALDFLVTGAEYTLALELRTGEITTAKYTFLHW